MSDEKLSDIYNRPYFFHRHREWIEKMSREYSFHNFENILLDYYKFKTGKMDGAIIPTTTIQSIDKITHKVNENHQISFGTYECLSKAKPKSHELRINKSFISPDVNIFESIGGVDKFVYQHSLNIPLVISTINDNSVIEDLSCHNFRALNVRGGCSALDKPSLEIDCLALIHDHICGANYTHWLLDWFPRILVLKEHGYDLRKLKFVLPHYLTTFESQLMSIIGIDVTNVINLPAKNTSASIMSNKIIGTSLSGERCFRHALNNGCFFLKEIINKLFLQKINFFTKIIINRRLNRIIRFDRNVNDFFIKYNFKEIYLEDLTVEEQVYLFRSATHIIGAHGAGLANLVFCQKNTKVLELFPADHSTSAFWTISLVCDLKYTACVVDYENVATNLPDVSRNLILHSDVFIKWMDS